MSSPTPKTEVASLTCRASRSTVALGLLVLAIVFAMTGFSLLIAALARTREQIVPLGLTIIMIVCALGGCWWPLYQEPDWLQRVPHLTLTAWSMEGVHDLILRDRALVDVRRTLSRSSDPNRPRVEPGSPRGSRG